MLLTDAQQKEKRQHLHNPATEIWPGYKKRIFHHEVVQHGPGIQRGRGVSVFQDIQNSPGDSLEQPDLAWIGAGGWTR